MLISPPPYYWQNPPPKRVVSVSYSPSKIRNDWPIPSKEDAKALIAHWAGFYGVDVPTALCIIEKESGFFSQAKNRVSSAAGLGQDIISTFNSTAKRMGHTEWNYYEHVFNADINAQLNMWLMATDGVGHWVVWPKCT